MIENLQTVIITECDMEELEKLRIVILQLAKDCDLINFKHILSTQIQEEKSEIDIFETESENRTEEDIFEFDAHNKIQYSSDKQDNSFKLEEEIISEMLCEEICDSPMRKLNKNKIKKGKHKCRYCSKRFKFSTSLEKHENKHFIEDGMQEKENKQEIKKQKVPNYVKNKKGN
jgi:hypothetical protein